MKRAVVWVPWSRLAAAAGLVAVSAGLYWATTDRTFAVDPATIPITGQRYTAEADIRAELDLPADKLVNIFRIPVSEIERRIEALPAVRDATVTATLPDQVTVSVTERSPMLVWRTPAGSWLVDGTGLLFGSAAAVDKIRTKEVLSFHGVRTPRFRILGRDDLARGRPGLADDLVGQFGTPLVVKDPLGGSSLEVRLCDDARQVMLALETLGPRAERLLVEAYARGREFTGGVLDDRERGRPTALPLVELKPKSARFFDYREKYDADGALEVCPADLPPAVEAAGRGLALEVHERLGLRGVSRTDMILEADGQFSVLEVNTMPGMTARSLIPKAAAVAGIDFPGVIDRLIRTAGLE